jgi:hypothetical protein
MRISEVAGAPDVGRLAALAQFLLGRATDTNGVKKISTTTFINLAQNMGITINQQQLASLSQQPPLNGIISNVEPNEITFKGAEPEVDDSDMSVDQARATVDKMAKRAGKKAG